MKLSREMKEKLMRKPEKDDFQVLLNKEDMDDWDWMMLNSILMWCNYLTAQPLPETKEIYFQDGILHEKSYILAFSSAKLLEQHMHWLMSRRPEIQGFTVHLISGVEHHERAFRTHCTLLIDAVPGSDQNAVILDPVKESEEIDIVQDYLQD